MKIVCDVNEVTIEDKFSMRLHMYVYPGMKLNDVKIEVGSTANLTDSILEING